MGFKCSQSCATVRLVTRASTTFTRFALALLVVSGLVAPVAAIEAARVVQTVGGKPSPQPRLALQVVRSTGEAPTRWSAAAFVEPVELVAAAGVRHPNAGAARRFLLHRAWLI